MRGLWLCRSVSCVLALSALLGARPAIAQKAEANLLFDEARVAMASRDYAQAISKLEQSQQLDPAVGTLLNLGECYVAVGRTASAWATYRDASSLAASTKQRERERFASRKAQELEARLSRLEVVVKPDARVPGLTISRSNVPIPEGLWGAAVPVDPGTQRLEAKAPGRIGWSLDVHVADADKVRIEVPTLAEVAQVAAPSPAPAVAPAPAPVIGGAIPEASTVSPGAPASAARSEPRSPSSLPTVGWVTVGAGAVAALAGLVFFVNGRLQISDANCPEQVCVRGIGNKDLHDDGRQNEKLGVGLGVAGAAVAAAGVVLVLSAQPGKRDGAAVDLRLKLAASGLDLRGAW